MKVEFVGLRIRLGMERLDSRDGTLKSSALGRWTALGRGVSPLARISRYLGAPTSYHFGIPDMMSWSFRLKACVSGGMDEGENSAGSSIRAVCCEAIAM